VPWAAAPAPGVYDRVLEAYTVDVERVRDEVNRLASDTAAGLRQLGIAATSAVREGDPAHEIVEFARERGAAIVVIGTRGQTGLTRFILGSVARNVLEHAPCSVLVVREKVAVRPETGTHAETLVSSGR
jgi:nucleotide-binding universal stress UspA family protein